jgi:hypothetical protein
MAATGIAVFAAAAAAIALGNPSSSQASEQHPDQVLEWNQIFIDTLVATNTRNSSSQRLGAIVHTAIFDAYNGIERRYTPIFVENVGGDGERLVPPGASRRAAVIAAAYTAPGGPVSLSGAFAECPGHERRCCDGAPESACRRPDIHADDGPLQQDVHQHLASSPRREQRPSLGRDALPQHGCGQRRSR